MAKKASLRKIERTLRSHRILGRKSTFNGTFAAALALHDDPKAEDTKVMIARAKKFFERRGDDTLCVYCGAVARTWDHLRNVTVKGRYSGFGHQVFNLVPACRGCNEEKRHLHWRDFLNRENRPDKKARIRRLARFEALLKSVSMSEDEMEIRFSEQMREYRIICSRVFKLLVRADEIADDIRALASEAIANRAR